MQWLPVNKEMKWNHILPCQRNSTEGALSFPVYPSKSLQQQILKRNDIAHQLKLQQNKYAKKLLKKKSIPDRFAMPMKTFASLDDTPALLNTDEEK